MFTLFSQNIIIPRLFVIICNECISSNYHKSDYFILHLSCHYISACTLAFCNIFIHLFTQDRVGALMNVANQISNIERLSGWGPPMWTSIAGQQSMNLKKKAASLQLEDTAHGASGNEEQDRDVVSSPETISQGRCSSSSPLVALQDILWVIEV